MIEYNEIISLVRAFIEWRDTIPKEIRGDVMMFDVKGHHKWLTEQELFDHYINVIRKIK